MLHFECPSCHAKCEAAAALGGQSIVCQKCGQRVEVPKDLGAITAASPPMVAPPTTAVTTPELAEAQQGKKRAHDERLRDPSIARANSSQAGPWLLIIGLLLGAGLLLFMTWDGIKHSKDEARHSEHVVAFTEANWEKEVIDSNIPVVVDFSAAWCGPCHAFAPTLDKIAERYKGKVKVGTLDVGDHSFNKANKLQAQYGINAIPCIMIFKGGELRKQFEGGPTEAQLARAIDSVLQ